MRDADELDQGSQTSLTIRLTRVVAKLTAHLACSHLGWGPRICVCNSYPSVILTGDI